MSKEFSKDIEVVFLRHILKPIRKKEDIVKLILETTKYFLVNNIVYTNESYGKIIIKIDKMNRVIYEIENKIFSIGFPFFITKEEEVYKVYEKDSRLEINSKIISIIIKLLNENLFEEEDVMDFFEKLCDVEEEIDIVWKILKKLLLFECGYLRADYDEEGENGTSHPLNHYDFYYTNSNTLKLGLDTRIELRKFIDLLDITTSCHYIKH